MIRENCMLSYHVLWAGGYILSPVLFLKYMMICFKYRKDNL